MRSIVGSGVFVFTPGAKFWWDIQFAEDLAIFYTPSVKLGYALATFGNTAHAFNFQFGLVEGRVVLGDRGVVFFKPVSLDMFAGDFGGPSFVMRYDLMFGGGVTF